MRARYLVGCDGPAGAIREQLGIELDGRGTIAKSLNLYFRSAELPAFHDKGWARFYRVIDETGCWGELIPIDGKELWRLTVFDAPLSNADPDFLLRKMAGGTFAYEMLSASPWERRDYVAASYRRGPRVHRRRCRARVLADRRHRHAHGPRRDHEPRLEACRHAGGLGRAESLLASYEAERRPIAVRNVEYATRSFNALAAIPGLQ